MSKPTLSFKPAKSSNISATAYDEATQTLAVRFANGGEYHYSGISKKLADEFHGAKSMGGFFASNIRGKFNHTMKGNKE